MQSFYDRFIKPPNVVPNSKLFSPEHLVLSALCIISIVFFINLQMKHCDENYSKKFLKRAAILMLVLEIFRISWRTYYYGFSLTNIRFDWCNQVCLTLPFIILSGNKKLFPYIDILAFMGGAGVIVYPIWVFYDYAGIHIMSIQSMVSHTLMVIISISTLFVSDHWQKEKNVKKPLIGFGIIAVISFVMSRLLNVNYMLMIRADGIPVLNRLSFPLYWLIIIPALIAIMTMMKRIFKYAGNKISARKVLTVQECDHPVEESLV